MKKILVTGGTGLLAVNWALEYRNKFNFILLKNKREIVLNDVVFKYVNLLSREEIRRVLEAELPDVVINTVAITSIEECEKNPLNAYKINTNMAFNVAAECSVFDIPMVHISTDHLFSGNLAFQSEDDKVEPLNVYAQTKAEAETLVLQAHKQALVIRTNFFGWGTSYRNSFSDNIINSLRLGKTISLFNDVFYNPILISTLIEAINDLLSKKERGVFNIVGNDRVSKYEFGLMLAKTFNLSEKLISPCSINERKDLIKRPLDMSLSNHKLKKILKRNLRSLEEEISLLKVMEENYYAKQISLI